MAATDFKDYYSILGVQRSADADEIKRSFRRLARKYHPDLNPGDAAAEARFKEINEAYEVLSDPSNRKKYDQFGQYWKQAGQAGPGFGGGAGGFDADFGRFNNFEDFINELLGRFNGPGTNYTSSYGSGPGSRSRSSANGFSSHQTATNLDQEAKLQLSFGEAFRGVRKSIKVNGESIDVNIPAGVKSGSKVRLRGKGMASAYGQRGDLYLLIDLQSHSFFQLDGDRLTCELPISPDEAALGAKVEVPTPDGMVTVNIPAGIRSGQSLRLRGKGWPKRGERGDQLVKVMIAVPKSLSEREREAYVALQQARTSDPRESLNNMSL